jgi:hypothetical protein
LGLGENGVSWGQLFETGGRSLRFSATAQDNHPEGGDRQNSPKTLSPLRVE